MRSPYNRPTKYLPVRVPKDHHVGPKALPVGPRALLEDRVDHLVDQADLLVGQVGRLGDRADLLVGPEVHLAKIS